MLFLCYGKYFCLFKMYLLLYIRTVSDHLYVKQKLINVFVSLCCSAINHFIAGENCRNIKQHKKNTSK